MAYNRQITGYKEYLAESFKEGNWDKTAYVLTHEGELKRIVKTLHSHGFIQPTIKDPW